MKTLKVLLQEVVSGIKAWVNSNFAQESNAVHKTGNETVNGTKTFTGNVFQNQAGGVNVYCATCDGAVKGDLTSSGTFSIVCKDGSNANMETSGLAAVYMGQDTSGSYVALRADTSYNNTRYNASVSLDIDPTTANNNAIFRPRRDNTIDLGSSSYQFKNLYANNYYYKGTAWGLDKSNVWSGRNDFKPNFVTVNSYRFRIKDQSMILGTVPSSNQWTGMQFVDTNETPISEIVQSFQSNGNSLYQINVFPNEANSVKRSIIAWSYNSANNVNALGIESDFLPLSGNTYNLGVSNKKWKTFNGLNPGALSIPDGFDSGADSSFTPDTTNWPKDGTGFQAEMPIVGWLRITIKNVAGNYAFVRRGQAGANLPWQIFADPTFATDFAEVTLNVPVTNGTYTLRINSPGGFTAKVYPCLGNV